MQDFYCDDVLNGKTKVSIVTENDHVLTFHHTKPHWPVHILVIPKKHISSLIDATEDDNEIIHECLHIIKTISQDIVKKHGACRVLTNLGKYQDSKHLHWHITYGDEF
ncbi:HIT domain-containing protein [Candidatus Gottesmanbacteria bacterium]|nr:HIT domain-containing protein [Candidatus Gottesmanbacteria bacterium]